MVQVPHPRITSASTRLSEIMAGKGVGSKRLAPHSLKMSYVSLAIQAKQAHNERYVEKIATEGFFTEMESSEYVLSHEQLLPQDFSFVAAVCGIICLSMLQILKNTISFKECQ